MEVDTKQFILAERTGMVFNPLYFFIFFDEFPHFFGQFIIGYLDQILGQICVRVIDQFFSVRGTKNG